MRDQLLALIWLRLTILWRIWTRSTSARAALVVRTVYVLFGVLSVLGASIGSFSLGFFLERGKLDGMALVLGFDAAIFAILIFWASALLTEISRGAGIDLRKLLHLPVSLRAVFALNFLAACMAPGNGLVLSVATGFSLGLAISQGPRMLLIIPLTVIFLLMLEAWCYHVRGWIAVMFENKRRRRVIISVATLCIVLLSQGPMIAQNVFFHNNRHNASSEQVSHQGPSPHTIETTFRRVNLALPPGWMALGAQAVAEHRYGAAGLFGLGMLGVGAVGYGLALRTTLRHYRGVGGKLRKVAPQKAVTSVRAKSIRTAATLPFLSDDLQALVFSTALLYFRHPQIRMQIFMQYVFSAVFVFFFFWKQNVLDISSKNHDLALLAAAGLSTLFSSSLLNNTFGLDGRGFQALMLLPAPRWKYLAARNLVLGPLGVLLFLGLAVAIAFMGEVRPIFFVTALVLSMQTCLLACTAGNVQSIYLPIPLNRDNLRANSAGGTNMFWAFLIRVATLPLVFASLFIVYFADLALSFQSFPVGLLLALVFLALTAGGYAMSLKPMGEYLQAREIRMREILRHEEG